MSHKQAQKYATRCANREAREWKDQGADEGTMVRFSYPEGGERNRESVVRVGQVLVNCLSYLEVRVLEETPTMDDVPQIKRFSWWKIRGKVEVL